MNLAPIAIFAYNRPIHLERVLISLQQNELFGSSKIYVFVDGPKNNNDVKKITQVNKILNNYLKGLNFEIIQKNMNIGLSKSIVGGINFIFEVEGHNRIIVLEDDIVVNKNFLKFMNFALDHFENKKSVWHIGGWQYPIDFKNNKENYLFFKYMNCWGWGTWKNRWSFFEKNPKSLITQFDMRMIKKFNYDNSHNFFSQILGNYENKIDTWAIFWYSTIFLNGGLCFYPRKTLCHNIGTDGEGTHRQILKIGTSFEDYEVLETDFKEIKIYEKNNDRSDLINYFKSINKVSLASKIVNKIKLFLK